MLAFVGPVERLGTAFHAMALSLLSVLAFVVTVTVDWLVQPCAMERCRVIDPSRR